MNRCLLLIVLLYLPVGGAAQHSTHARLANRVVRLRGWGKGQQFAYASRADVIEAQPGHAPKWVKTDEQAREYIGTFLTRMLIIDSGTKATVLARTDILKYSKVKTLSGKYAGRLAWIECKYVH